MFSTSKIEEIKMASTAKFNQSTDIQSLAPSDIAKLSISEIQSLTKDQLGSLSPEQVSGLNDKQLAVLSFKYVEPSVLSGISEKAAKGLPINLLDADQFNALPTNVVAKLTIEQVGSMKKQQISGLDSEHFAAFTAGKSGNIAGLNLKLLDSEQISNLTETQIASLSTTQLSNLSSKQLAGITPEQANAFTKDQSKHLKTLDG
jgi:trimeric autotransporter adhesin